MITHKGEKPYQGSYCKKILSDNNTPTKHLRAHTGSYMQNKAKKWRKIIHCSKCNNVFTHLGHLKYHLMS